MIALSPAPENGEACPSSPRVEQPRAARLIACDDYLFSLSQIPSLAIRRMADSWPYQRPGGNYVLRITFYGHEEWGWWRQMLTRRHDGENLRPQPIAKLASPYSRSRTPGAALPPRRMWRST